MAARANGGARTEVCPMCLSPFSEPPFRLAACVGCGGEGSTACCMAPTEQGRDAAERCHVCEDAS